MLIIWSAFYIDRSNYTLHIVHNYFMIIKSEFCVEWKNEK